MKNRSGSNARAVGGVLVGLAVMGLVFSLVFIYTDFHYYHHTFDLTKKVLFVAVPFILLCFYVGSIFLAVGLTLKYTYIPESESIVQTNTLNRPDKNEIISKNNEEKAEEKTKESNTENSGMIICPHCGKEQHKNAYGCIFCHKSFD